MLFKVLGICLIAAVLAVLLKQYKSEYSFLCTAAAATVIFLIVLGSISRAVTDFSALLADIGNSGYYFKIALKSLGIAYLTSFCADMCRDFGLSSLASKTELAGKTAIFLLAIPLLKTLLQIALKAAAG